MSLDSRMKNLPPISVSQEMIEERTMRSPVHEAFERAAIAINQDEWCRIYTGRSWFNDVSHEWAAHAALMCDAAEIDFGDPLLSPLGACDHPYDIAKPCALRTWEHYKPTDKELAQWWSAQ